MYILDSHRRLTAPARSYKAQAVQRLRRCFRRLSRAKHSRSVSLKAQPSKAQSICVFEGSAEQSSVELCFRKCSRPMYVWYFQLSSFSPSALELSGKPNIEYIHTPYYNMHSFPTCSDMVSLFPNLCKSVQNASGTPRQRPTTFNKFKYTCSSTKRVTDSYKIYLL